MALRPTLRLALAGLATAGLGTAALAQDAPAEGRISIETRGGTIFVEGSATAFGAGTYDVALDIVKTGKSGRAATRQGSALTLAAGETRSVGRMGFNLMPGDELSVAIEVSRDGQIVSRSSSDLRY